MSSPAPAPTPTAPLDYLQFFDTIFRLHRTDALVVTDASRTLSLFVARDQDAALRFIQQDSSQTRALLLEAPASDPAEAARSPLIPSHQPSQLPLAIPDSDASLTPSDDDAARPDHPSPSTHLPIPKRRRLHHPPTAASSDDDVPQDLQYTVTSRNRNKLRSGAKRRQQSPPHPPSSLSSPASPTSSRASTPASLDRPQLPRPQTPSEARCRLALTTHHLPELTWLMAQPVPASTAVPGGSLPYRLAQQIITNAMAVGNARAIQTWKSICAHWRTHGSLTTVNLYAHNPSSSQALSTPAHLAHAARAVQDLYRIFQTVNQSEVDSSLHLMFHRRYFADLFQHYSEAEVALAAEPPDGPRPRGMTNAALVKQRLFLSLHPEHTALTNPRTHAKSQKAWDEFHRKLERGRRWLYLRDQTNPGIFALIPDSVSNRWVEKDLPYDIFCAWVNLIHRFNQPAIALGEAMLPGLQHALAGRSMPDRKIRLEITDIGDLASYSDTSVLFRDVDESSAED
jgi:hypothetical protein